MLDPDSLHSAKAVAEELMTAEQTLARWRSENEGPPFVKIGGRVAYLGRDVAEWVAEQRIEPTSKAYRERQKARGGRRKHTSEPSTAAA